MQKTSLDPKLYLAARTGDIESFIMYAELSGAELDAFLAEPDNEVVINVGYPDEEPANGDANGVPLQQVSQFLRLTSAGDTVLHIATLFQQTVLATKICQVRRSLLNRPNNNSETPLHYAAQTGNRDLVQYFNRVASGDNNIHHVDLLQKKNRNGETALYQAVLHQHQNVVRELMQHAPVDQVSILNGQHASPLYLAITLNSYDIVDFLLKNLPPQGSEWLYLGPDGQTALHAATLRDNGCAELILNWKPELTEVPDKSDRTPLHYAASLNNPEVVKKLFKNENIIPSAYRTDSFGLYPVHVAAKLGHLEVLMELLNHCPDSEELLDRQGRNFLHLAIENKRVNVVQFVCKQTKFDRILKAQDDQGNTPLHLAVEARSLTMLSSLILSKSVQLNWVNKKGFTALDIAYAQGINNFSLWQNVDCAMYQTLYRIGCIHGLYRSYCLIGEGDSQVNEDRKKKETERNTKIAKSISTIGVLIAAATFAALFAVSDVFINNKDSYKTLDLADDFYWFVLFDAGAFVCSALAALLVEGTLNFLNQTDQKVFLRICANCVMIAAKSFIMAFATGACVVLTPLNPDLARFVEFLASVGGICFILLLQWEGILLTMAIIWYKGVKALFRAAPDAPSKVPAKLPTFIRILYFVSETLLLDYVMSVVIVVYLVDFIMEFSVPAYISFVVHQVSQFMQAPLHLQFVTTTLLVVITTVMYVSKAITRIVGPFS